MKTPLEDFTVIELNPANKPAVMAALAHGDFDNAVVASIPGGIERQEAAGQQALVASERLPIKGLFRDTPLMQEYLEGLGFVFGEPLTGQDAIFIECQLPTGWRKVATDHSMWSDLLDAQGRKRAAIFFKAAFYDYNAHIRFNNRYSITDLFCDGEGKVVKYDEHTHTQWALTDGGEPFERVGVPLRTFTKVPEQDKLACINANEEAGRTAKALLLEKFPESGDPKAYWD